MLTRIPRALLGELISKLDDYCCTTCNPAILYNVIYYGVVVRVARADDGFPIKM